MDSSDTVTEIATNRYIEQPLPPFDELAMYLYFFKAIPYAEFTQAVYDLGAKLTDQTCKEHSRVRMDAIGMVANEDDILLINKLYERLTTSYSSLTYADKIYSQASVNDIQGILDWMGRVELRMKEHCSDLLAIAKIKTKLLKTT